MIDNWFFGICCISLVEVTEKNFRLLFPRKADVQSYLRYCDTLQEWNKQTVVEDCLLLLHNIYEIMEWLQWFKGSTKLYFTLFACGHYFAQHRFI